MAESKLIVTIAGQFDSLDKAVKGAVEKVKSMGANLTSIGSSLALGISAPLAAFGVIAIKTSADLEALKSGLTTVTGSAKAAEAQFRELSQVAKLPGIGLQEAVRGAANLQALKFSFADTKRILIEFSNALASVGRGREDLEEVIRQLGQMASRGKVTADNLKPILERVPQVAAIIREKFGTVDTEVLQKMGVSAKQLTEVLLDGLSKQGRAADTLKNQLDNLSQDISNAFAAAGNALAPFVKQFIEDFATPAIARLKSLAEGFRDLSSPVQTAAVALGGISIAAPLVIAGLGSMLSNFALVTEAITKMGGAAKILSGILRAIPWVALAGGILYLGDALLKNRDAEMGAIQSQKDLEGAISKTIAALRKQGVAVDEANRFKTTPARTMMFAGKPVEVIAAQQGTESTKEFIKYLNELAIAHGKTAPPTKAHADALAELTEEMRKIQDENARQTWKDASHWSMQTTGAKVMAAQMAILNEAHEEHIKKLARERLGLHLIWDEAPQFDIISDKIKGLGDDLGFVGGEARRTAAALKPITLPSDIGKLDVLQNRQRGNAVEADFKAAVKAGEESFKASAQQAKRYGQQVSLIANDIARNITDLTFKGGKLGDVLKGTFIEISKSIQRAFIETQLKNILGRLTEITTKAPAVQKALKDLFGLGADTASTVAANASKVPGVPSVPGAPSVNRAGSVAGSALSGWIGAVASVGTLVSSIFGNFQFAGMNKSLDIIVKHTLQTANQLIYGIQPSLNTYLPYLKLIHERSFELSAAGGGGGSRGDIHIDLRGSTFGGGTTQHAVESMFREAARKMALAGAA